jgi:hypothetical protein
LVERKVEAVTSVADYVFEAPMSIGLFSEFVLRHLIKHQDSRVVRVFVGSFIKKTALK